MLCTDHFPGKILSFLLKFFVSCSSLSTPGAFLTFHPSLIHTINTIIDFLIIVVSSKQADAFLWKTRSTLMFSKLLRVGKSTWTSLRKEGGLLVEHKEQLSLETRSRHSYPQTRKFAFEVSTQLCTKINNIFVLF